MSQVSNATMFCATQSKFGRSLVVLDLPTGGKVAVLPQGGRIIGLWSKTGENHLWTHPGLGDPLSAASFFTQKGWPNSGGDRCWLAPEIDLFFPPGKIGDPGFYAVPATLDPGDYQVTQGANAISMQQSVGLSAGGLPVTARITRCCTGVSDPYARNDLTFAGYALKTELCLTGPEPVRLGLWQLLQLPAPGTMLLASKGQAKIWEVFGDFRADTIRNTAQGLQWDMNSGATRKIAVLASQTGSRCGHLRQDKHGDWHLVVREFSVDPSGDYCDALWNNPAQRGFAFQSCLVDHPTLGRFNELEHHSPAAIANGPAVCDHSTVLAWSGPAENIRSLTNFLFPSS